MTQHARSFFGRAMDCGGANIIPSSRLLSPSSSKYSRYGLPRKYLILVGGGGPQDEREGIIVPSST